MRSSRRRRPAGPPLLLLLLLLLLLQPGTLAVVVSNQNQLLEALGDSGVSAITLSGPGIGFVSSAATPIQIGRPVEITSETRHGQLDLANGVWRRAIIGPGGSLTLRALTLTGFDAAANASTAPPPQQQGAAVSPLAGFDVVPGGRLRVEDCVLVLRRGGGGGAVAGLAERQLFWEAAVAAGALVAADGAPVSGSGSSGGGSGSGQDTSSVLVNYTARSLSQRGIAEASVVDTLLLFDPSGCFAAGGGAAVYDTASLAAALADARAPRATVVTAVEIGAPAYGRLNAAALRRLYAAPLLARRLDVGACAGAAIDFAGLRNAVVAGRGGVLALWAPLAVVDLASRAEQWPAAPPPPAAPQQPQQQQGQPPLPAQAPGSVCTVPDEARPLRRSVGFGPGARLELRAVQIREHDAGGIADELRGLHSVSVTRGGGGGGGGYMINGTANDGAVAFYDVELVEDAGCFDRSLSSAGASAKAGTLRELRAALADARVRRVEVTADLALDPPQDDPDHVAWGAGGGGGGDDGPRGTVVITRPVEVRACRGSGDGAPLYTLAFGDAEGAIVVAPGAALRFAGDLRLAPCSLGRARSCLDAWPAVPAVALAPGAQLELAGVVVEAPAPLPLDFGASDAPGAPAALVAPKPARGCNSALLVRRAVVAAADLWRDMRSGSSSSGGGGGGGQRRLRLKRHLRRRLLAAAAAPGGGVAAPGRQVADGAAAVAAGAAAAAAAGTPAYYVYSDTLLVVGNGTAVFTAAAARHHHGPSPGTVAGAVVGSVLGAALVAAAVAAGFVMWRRRRRQQQQLYDGDGDDAKPALPVGAERRANGSSGGRSGGSAGVLSRFRDSLRLSSRSERTASGGTRLLDANAPGAAHTEHWQLPWPMLRRARSDMPPTAAAAAVAATAPAQQLPPPPQAAAGGLWGRRALTFNRSAAERQRAYESAAATVRDMQRAPAWRGAGDDLVLDAVLGEGTFGKVYKGYWKGTVVAVKRMTFPAGMSGAVKRERMAVMETAISSRLRHPNVVQLYAFDVRPVTDPLDARGGGAGGDDDDFAAGGWRDASFTARGAADEARRTEVRLILEYCDRGTLRELLDADGAFCIASPRSSGGGAGGGGRDMRAVVATALDVAKAMLHLHSTSVVHGDLKARNVLLKADAASDDGRGFMAKVADFGLSLQLPEGASHVSGAFQGTMTHMAPEVMLEGRVSKASDVYAFGVLLWELYTGQHAFKGVPRALLGHEVAYQQRRPTFPLSCPFDYQLLACRCWESDHSIRPNFRDILDTLTRMQANILAEAGAAAPAAAAAAAAAAGGLAGARTASGATLTAAALMAAAAAAVGRGAPTLRRAASDDALTLRTLSASTTAPSLVSRGPSMTHHGRLGARPWLRQPGWPDYGLSTDDAADANASPPSAPLGPVFRRAASGSDGAAAAREAALAEAGLARRVASATVGGRMARPRLGLGGLKGPAPPITRGSSLTRTLTMTLPSSAASGGTLGSSMAAAAVRPAGARWLDHRAVAAAARDALLLRRQPSDTSQRSPPRAAGYGGLEQHQQQQAYHGEHLFDHLSAGAGAATASATIEEEASASLSASCGGVGTGASGSSGGSRGKAPRRPLVSRLRDLSFQGFSAAASWAEARPGAAGGNGAASGSPWQAGGAGAAAGGAAAAGQPVAAAAAGAFSGPHTGEITLGGLLAAQAPQSGPSGPPPLAPPPPSPPPPSAFATAAGAGPPHANGGSSPSAAAAPADGAGSAAPDADGAAAPDAAAGGAALSLDLMRTEPTHTTTGASGSQGGPPIQIVPLYKADGAAALLDRIAAAAATRRSLTPPLPSPAGATPVPSSGATLPPLPTAVTLTRSRSQELLASIEAIARAAALQPPVVAAGSGRVLAAPPDEAGVRAVVAASGEIMNAVAAARAAEAEGADETFWA